MMKNANMNALHMPKEAKREAYLAMRGYMEKKDPGEFATLKQACAKACPAMEEKAVERVAESLAKDWTMRLYFGNLKGAVFKSVATAAGIAAVAVGFQLASVMHNEPPSPILDALYWGLAGAAVLLSISKARDEFKAARQEMGKLLERLARKEIDAKSGE